MSSVMEEEVGEGGSRTASSLVVVAAGEGVGAELVDYQGTTLGTHSPHRRCVLGEGEGDFPHKKCAPGELGDCASSLAAAVAKAAGFVVEEVVEATALEIHQGLETLRTPPGWQL